MEAAPLPGTFMLTSMLGFFVSAFYVVNLSETWGFAFMLVFVLMFIASIISMVKADAKEEIALDNLAFHRTDHGSKKEIPSRSEVKRMTKDEIKKYASEHWGVVLSTNDLKKEMIDQMFDEIQ